ncbi:MAG TPA: hypothetical protein VNG11_04075 [Chloroflexota bacterium]|nr:hypothetical protein [Chloroflexota bacterium]
MGLPEMTVDMDGVLCRPFLGVNFVISRDVQHPPDVQRVRQTSAIPRSVRWLDSKLGQGVRYGWRLPMPQVADGLAALADVRRLILLTGRPESARTTTEQWLIRHSLRDYFSEIVLNDRGLSNAAFKLLKTRERGIMQHVDDDGRVAYFLAKDAPRTVFLIAWPKNDGLPYPPTVHRVNNLREAAKKLRQLSPPLIETG